MPVISFIIFLQREKEVKMDLIKILMITKLASGLYANSLYYFLFLNRCRTAILRCKNEISNPCSETTSKENPNKIRAM